MSTRPRLLDLFCGAGGASMGYHRAGFDVTGVDIAPMPRYPFRFEQADALEYVAEHGAEYDAIHASPPCQGYSRMNRAVQAEHPKLIGKTRALLLATGRPWAIENVEGADVDPMALTLCGTMFGLRVRRHRRFELWPARLDLASPCSCRLGVVTGRLIGHRTHGKVAPGRTKPPRHTETELRAAMGVDWMTTQETRQAIPPAYTEWVGRRLLDDLAAAAWVPCSTCDDYWCTVHGAHAHECSCPPIEEWETDPYAPRVTA